MKWLIMSFALSLLTYASYDFDAQVYYPQDYISKKLCTEIYSPEVNELLKEKLVYDKSEKLIANLCINGDDTKVDFVYKFEKSDEILSDVLDLYKKKSEFVFPTKYKKFLEGFTFKREKDFILATSTDSKIANEILIFKKKKGPIDKMIIKRAVGTTTLNLKWIKYKWSKQKYVLTKMEIERREGVQNVNSTIFINYHNLLTIGLPSKITVFTNQNVISIKSDQTRKSKNSYFLENYKL